MFPMRDLVLVPLIFFALKLWTRWYEKDGQRRITISALFWQGNLDAQVLVEFKSLKKYSGDSMRGNARKKTEGKG